MCIFTNILHKHLNKMTRYEKRLQSAQHSQCEENLLVRLEIIRKGDDVQKETYSCKIETKQRKFLLGRNAWKGATKLNLGRGVGQ